jgi:hypothetical protein
VRENLEIAEKTIRGQEESKRELRRELEQKAQQLTLEHQQMMDSMQASHNLEKEEFLTHLAGAENTVLDLRSELEKRMKTQSDLVRKLAAQEELTQSLLSQQTSDERVHAKTKQELFAASAKIVGLQDEVRKLAGKNAALEEACQNLRIEENKWKRVDRLKMERELKDLEEQNTNMRDQLRALRANQSGASMPHDVLMERIRELEAANQRLELENLRRRGELEAAGLEDAPEGARNIYTLSDEEGEGGGGSKGDVRKLLQRIAELELLLKQANERNETLQDEIEGNLSSISVWLACTRSAGILTPHVYV